MRSLEAAAGALIWGYRLGLQSAAQQAWAFFTDGTRNGRTSRHECRPHQAKTADM
jgi:hypothetical protein